ncbi:MAG: dienelactone hydrolase family protein [Dehalococcoidia bacterium]|nr:dienelactone hydrolase family protein [Dehalococcoidia bacterium]
MAGEMVSFASNGGQAGGYLARPSAAKAAGVIVIQEWWGLVPHIRDVADRFAAAGYLALAPDLYHGEQTTEPDEAGKMMMSLKLDEAARDLGAAFDYLKAHDACTGKVGCVGYCMGGGLSFYLATLRPVDACVIYYGVLQGVEPDLSKLAGPVMGHYGTIDAWASPQVAHNLEQQIRDAGKHAQFYIYEGTDHAFFNDARPEVYNRAAAALSWDRTIDFFDAQLK